MKSFPTFAAAALFASALAMPALAQSTDGAHPWYMPSGFYGNLGYSNTDSTSQPDPDLNSVTGRIGARFGRYLGVEGEGSVGFGSDTQTFAGDVTRTHVNDQYAGYVVGFLPVLPHLDLLARVGYGGQEWNVKDDTLGTSHTHQFDTVNYGVGGQYDFNGKDGVRVDYTRFGAQNTGDPSSNVYTVSYVRKF